MSNRTKILLTLSITLLVTLFISYIIFKGTYSVATDFDADIVYSIISFGANGNDEASDSVAFQNALDKAKIELLNNTGNVIKINVPDGIYYLDKPIYIYSNTIISLSDNAVIKRRGNDGVFLQATLIDSKGERCNTNQEITNSDCNIGGYNQWKNIIIEGGTWDYNKVYSSFVFRHGENIIIRNTLFINDVSLHAINLSSTKDILIDNVTIKDQDSVPGTLRPLSGSEAIHIDFAEEAGEPTAYPLDGTPVKNLTVQNCIFDNVLSGIGSHAYSSNATRVGDNIIIRNNTFTNVSYFAITLFAHKNVQIYNNTAIGKDGAYAFVTTANTGANIHDNRVVNFENNIVYSGNNERYKNYYKIKTDEEMSQNNTDWHFTIKYIANGGEGTMEDTEVTIGIDTPLRTNAFTRNGYDFIGWRVHRVSYDTWYSSYFIDDKIKRAYLTMDEISEKNANIELLADESTVSYTIPFHKQVVELIAEWKKIKNITIENVPYTTEYLKGVDDVDLTGGELRITYTDNSSIIIPMSLASVSEYDKNILGVQKIILSYSGINITLNVSVVTSIDNININSMKVDTSGKMIYRINPDTSFVGLNDALKKIKEPNISFNNAINTGNIKNCSTVVLNENNKNVEYTLSVLGDITGDGNIKINDVARIYRTIKKNEKINESCIFEAADIVSDGEIKINDVSRLYRYLKGRRDTLQ